MSTPAGHDKSNGFHPQSGHSGLLPAPTTTPDRSSTPSQRPISGTTAISGPTVNEKSSGSEDRGSSGRAESRSVSSNGHTLASQEDDAVAENREKRRIVQPLPPWVRSKAEGDDAQDPSKQHLLPRTPSSIQPASHPYVPTPKPGALPGRAFDHVRTNEAVTISRPLTAAAPRWQTYIRSASMPSLVPGHEIVDENWLRENMPDLDAPWQPEESRQPEEKEPGFWLFNPEKRRRKLAKIQRTILKNPMVPLVVRLIVITFSALALGLAGSIFEKASRHGCQRGSSTWIALIVDILAIIYSIGITYDEYTSKPLGLRSHRAKMRLIFLDLFFIVFDSANLSLAFESLTDERWACRDGISTEDEVNTTCPLNDDICRRQKALTATLLIALVAWLATFAISIMRLIERVIGTR